MKIIWDITNNDILRLQRFIRNSNNYFIQKRKERNVEKINIKIDRESIIKTLIMCLLTSQQRSGPNTPIGKFFNLDPFPLTSELISRTKNLKEYTKQILIANGLKRFKDKISEFFAENIKMIEADNWHIIDLINQIDKNTSKNDECEIADYLNDWLKGFGPKQSRNFLQTLGLTRYEIPIDSRIIKWLNDFGFPVTLTSTSLSDKYYYHFVLDGIQALCEKANIYPCIFDAAIFSSFDKGEWNENNMFY